ncbi:S-adenosyl-L-methionine-dependent methyltransferase [Phytophthora cactorum]|nr:S-adenosyl-L-methionine-dependent methyltransferase [Phytophthora cactorum]
MSPSEAPHRGHHGMPSPPRPGEFEVVYVPVHYVRQHATPRDAQSVVDAMDNFAYEQMWMMNIGDVKGAIVDAEIEKAKPQVMAEIGAFCGYSAVRFASKLRAVSDPSARFYSFEFSEHFANIAKQIVDLAELSDVVTFFVGPFSETYMKLKELDINHVDVFFMDHDKRQYLSDFKLIEQSGLLKPGAVVVADNVLSPGPGGLPDYLEYVRSNPKFKSVMHESFVEYQVELKDGVEVTTGRMSSVDEKTPLVGASPRYEGDNAPVSSSAAALAPTLSSDDAVSTSPGRLKTRVRVGLDAAVLDNQKKWKRLTDIDDDNSTAKSMASEVQLEFMRHRQQLAHEQKRRLGSGIPTYHLDTNDEEQEAEEDPILAATEYGTALEEDRYLIAAAFIKDGVHGRKIGYRLDRDALLLNNLFHSESYRLVYILVVAIMCALAFVENPGDENINTYLLVDLLCLFVFGVDLAIRWYMSSVETQHKYVTRQPWAVVRMILLLITCADLLVNLLFPSINPYRYSRALRPFFFICRGRNIRIIFSSFLHALREVLIVLGLSFCFVAFFGLVGYLIFSDTSADPSATFFNSLSSSMYTMLLILNCMPYMARSMYPYYKMTHWSAIFFVLFVLLTNLFLLKLTIAVSYKSYKKNTESMLYKRLQKRKAALYAAFDILAQNVNFNDDDVPTNPPASGTPLNGASDISLVSNAPMLNAANRRGSSRFFLGTFDRRASFNITNPTSNTNLVTPVNKRQISLESWINVCEYLKPKWTATDAELVFNTVDIEHVGFLDLTDFYQLCSLLSVQLERPTLFSNSLMRRCCTSRQRQAIRRFRNQVRSTLLYEVHLFGRYRVVLAELVVGMLICLSVVQAVQVNNIQLAFSSNHSWRLLGFFLLNLFTLEVLVKMFAFGYNEFFTRPFCKLDLAVVSVGWLFYALTTLSKPPNISLVFYDMALAVRSLRFLKLLNLFPPFHEIMYTMKAIMPLIMQLLLVIFSVMYAFAIVTQANYGIELRDFPASKQSLSPGWYAQREEFQTETFEGTLVTLFGVANLAGWDAIMDAAHAMTGSDSTYVFFFTYRMTMSNILLPIFVGFLVESFVSNAKTVESTTSYVNSAHQVKVDDEEDRMTLLETRHMQDDDDLESANNPPLSTSKLLQERRKDEPPGSPSSVSDSSASEVRFKYRRRGSVVHDQMFDAVKLSDVSRLTLQVEQKEEELAQQDIEIHKLEGNVLSMKNRLNQSQHVILAYEAKMEELSRALREAQDRQLELETRQTHSLQQPTSEGALNTLGHSRSARPKRDRSSSWKLWTANV